MSGDIRSKANISTSLSGVIVAKFCNIFFFWSSSIITVLIKNVLFPKFCIIELSYWVFDNEFLTSDEESTLGIFTVKVEPPVKSIPGLSPPKIIKIKPIIITRPDILKKDNLYFESCIYISFI